MILLFFCSMFLLAHLHLFFKITDVFSFNPVVTFLLSLIMFFMAVSPLTIHFFYRGDGDYSKRLTYISHMWVAYIVLFFFIAVTLDIYNIGIMGAGYERLMLPPEYILFIPLVLAGIFLIIGFMDAKKLRVERLTVKTSKLPEGLRRLRILQISDLHLGIILGEDMLNKVIAVIKDVEPDLIVSTGDLLNAELDHIDYLSEHLKRLKPKFGKYAVTGNHESYVGIEHAVRFIEDSGFRLLRDESMTIDNMIGIAGMDDMAVKKMAPDTGRYSLSEEEILSELPDDRFRLLLKHRPNINKDSLGLFDLQLSGHTHKGQIFPVHLAIKVFFPYYAGHYKLSDGSAVYTSRGTGTAGPPVRFLAPPEITVIDLVSDI